MIDDDQVGHLNRNNLHRLRTSHLAEETTGAFGDVTQNHLAFCLLLLRFPASCFLPDTVYSCWPPQVVVNLVDVVLAGRVVESDLAVVSQCLPRRTANEHSPLQPSTLPRTAQPRTSLP